MALHAESISQRQFRNAWRGCARGEVEAFLREVAAAYDDLEGELAAAQQTARGAAEAERLLQRTLVAAQRTADETVALAREEAAEVLSRTAAEADELLEAARREAAAQREEARGLLADARDAVEQLRRFRDDYRDRVRLVVAEQLAALDRAGELPDIPSDLASLTGEADLVREVRPDETVSQADAGVSALGDGRTLDDETAAMHVRRHL